MLRAFFTFLLLVVPATAAAQFLQPSEPNVFSVSLQPQYPVPHGQVVVSVLSDILDLANATMVVMVDGEQIYVGNVKPVSISLGATGSISRVKVSIASGGADYEQTLSIQPQDVVLITEPVSSIPPLYPGKSSVPLEGSSRVVAVADFRNAGGAILDPSKLSYAWTVEDARVADSSGIGRNSILVASPIQYRARNVSVTVTSQDGNLVGGGSVMLSPRQPSLRIYENDPLLGIRFERAVSGTYAVRDAEASLYAAPFSVSTIRGAPLLEWFLNGSRVQGGNSITLRPVGEGKGAASLSAIASAGQYIRATMSLSLTFGEGSGGLLFGI